jgi:hypothetical protein
MAYGDNQYFIVAYLINHAIGKPMGKTTPGTLAQWLPRFREVGYTADSRLYFYEKRLA